MARVRTWIGGHRRRAEGDLAHRVRSDRRVHPRTEALALRVDDIGSTSVPGVPAKDVIDVRSRVAALDRERLAPRSTLPAACSP
jgi:hypothetical protein